VNEIFNSKCEVFNLLNY